MNSIHSSSKNETARLFQSNFCEFFTKVHPATPLIYLPFLIYLFYLSVTNPLLSWLRIFVFLMGGFLFWTLFEYFFHRFLFHFSPRGAYSKKLLYLFHEVHHDYPNDAKRLVMPPIVSLPFALFFYFLFQWFLGSLDSKAFYVGFGLGYLLYDLLHYAIHHISIPGNLFSYLKRNHLTHHYKKQNQQFGVSYPLWDFVFNTYY